METRKCLTCEAYSLKSGGHFQQSADPPMTRTLYPGVADTWAATRLTQTSKFSRTRWYSSGSSSPLTVVLSQTSLRFQKTNVKCR
eukprot:485761-Prorocentrum_lima.AAC.1